MMDMAFIICYYCKEAADRRAFAGHPLTATSTPVAIGFRRARRNAWEGDLFRFGPSSPVVSSGTAEAQVVVAVVGVVVVAVRGAYVTRVVVPGPAAEDTVRAGFSITFPGNKATSR